MRPKKKFSESVVLVIDDELFRIKPILKKLKNSIGHLHTASSADEGLKLYKELWAKIDYVILDQMMAIPDEWTENETNLGRETGYALLERLKKINNKVKIISFSHFKRHNMVRDSEFRGDIILYVNKPVLPSAFVSRVRNAVK
jgi:CheY-like chemotaxis protein